MSSPKQTQKSSMKTRKLAPVFVENTDGQDIRELVYVRDDKGEFKSLAELQYTLEESVVIPGVLTTSIETSGDAPGTTTIVSVSPFRLCCVISGGRKICYVCP